MILPPRSLRLLARLKLVALVRRQKRRLRTLSGALFGLLGFVLFGFWLFSISMGRRLSQNGLEVLRPDAGGEALSDGGSMLLGVQLGCGFLCLMTVVGALNHRGLYLPKEEIERLFSAPIRRSDLVRYRLVTNLGRSLFAGILFGFLTWGRLPHVGYGFAGVFLSILTLPIVGQAASLLAGSAENRWMRRLSGGRLRSVSIALGVLLWFAIMGLVFGGAMPDAIDLEDGNWAGRALEVLEHPVTVVVLAPFRPWAAMITAPDAAAFLPWFALCAVLWVLLYELTARIPIDFRELSLETSADVARRLKRLGSRGFGASSGKVSKSAAGRRVPWLFGHGPFGAVAWLKLASIFRKARGTMLMSAAIVTLLTAVFTVILPGEGREEVVGSASLIAVIGAFYLCAGLRFDFRMDLDQMASIKSWPVRPRTLFLATLLPEVMLVTGLLWAAVLFRTLVAGAWHPLVLVVLFVLPLFTLNWVAIDNSVFLLAPVRFVPGQEGALHHAGRSFVLWFLRMLILTLIVGVGGLAAFLAVLGATDLAGFGETGAFAFGAGAGCLVLFAAAGFLVVFGGWCLHRFDVARDRG